MDQESFLIGFFLESSATLNPLLPIYSISFIYFYFFFFSAHFAHNFVFITFVNSALLFFSTSRFFLFTLFLIDPFPLILFFFFLFSNAFLSSSSAFYCSYFSKIYLFVLSIVPITFGSTVMVYGGNFYSKL